jgi:predicted glycoside hydrolase/deacetylase ChbG (UPF0249 family)
VSTEGLLIVNADDWGGFREGTDAIKRCFELGAVSSSTAMVHMADSDRAAVLAREHGLPIGLHLNLTQPFDAPDVPARVRERQRCLCAHFSSLHRQRWTYSPNLRIHRLIADGVEDQLECFRENYGAEPTHVDSHHHVHVCPDVFLSRALAPGTRVRQTLSRTPSEPPGFKKLANRVKHEMLARRFNTTDRFWRALEVSGGDGAIAIAAAVELSLSQSIEIMVHPSFESELRILRSDVWLEALSRSRLVAYSAL